VLTDGAGSESSVTKSVSELRIGKSHPEQRLTSEGSGGGDSHDDVINVYAESSHDAVNVYDESSHLEPDSDSAG